MCYSMKKLTTKTINIEDLQLNSLLLCFSSACLLGSENLYCYDIKKIESTNVVLYTAN